MTTLDKVRGMLMGIFLGDALGVPHEFKCNSKVIYTGNLEYRGFNFTRFQGKKELEIGQVSDDSEMSLTLLRSIIKDNGYIKDNVIKSYMTWCNSENLHMLGTNTRYLFKNIKTLKGYQNRMKKILLLPEDQISQSNGSLMRVAPLALLKDDLCIIEDCNITNPNKVNRDCSLIYVKSLRMALQGVDNVTIFENAKNIAITDEVKFVLKQVENKEYRDMSYITGKGHVLHAIYCTFMIISYDNFSEAMAWIINQKGCDTDTLAAISGAMLGAVLGFTHLKSEPQTDKNIHILLNVDTKNGPTPRENQYQPFDFYTLSESAYNLSL